MKNLSLNQKRAIFICAGLLILVCVFFFLYQKNMDTVSDLERETKQFKNSVNYLSALQQQVTEMQETSPKYQKEIETYTKRYPCKMTQQKAVYNIYQMMVKSGVRVTAIKPGDKQTFYNAGQFIALSSSGTSEEGMEAVSEAGVEANPETQVPIDEMVGKVTSYEVEVHGKQKQIMKALDWVAKNSEPMSVGRISLNFDASNGNLSGTLTILYYEMNGNGRAYSDPNISGILIGTDSIFGILRK